MTANDDYADLRKEATLADDCHQMLDYDPRSVLNLLADLDAARATTARLREALRTVRSGINSSLSMHDDDAAPLLSLIASVLAETAPKENQHGNP